MSWHYNKKEDTWEEICNPYEFEHEQVVIYYRGEKHQGYGSPNGKGIIYWQNGKNGMKGNLYWER